MSRRGSITVRTKPQFCAARLISLASALRSLALVVLSVNMPVTLGLRSDTPASAGEATHGAPSAASTGTCVTGSDRRRATWFGSIIGGDGDDAALRDAGPGNAAPALAAAVPAGPAAGDDGRSYRCDVDAHVSWSSDVGDTARAVDVDVGTDGSGASARLMCSMSSTRSAPVEARRRKLPAPAMNGAKKLSRRLLLRLALGGVGVRLVSGTATVLAADAAGGVGDDADARAGDGELALLVEAGPVGDHGIVRVLEAAAAVLAEEEEGGALTGARRSLSDGRRVSRGGGVLRLVLPPLLVLPALTTLTLSRSRSRSGGKLGESPAWASRSASEYCTRSFMLEPRRSGGLGVGGAACGSAIVPLSAGDPVHGDEGVELAGRVDARDWASVDVDSGMRFWFMERPRRSGGGAGRGTAVKDDALPRLSAGEDDRVTAAELPCRSGRTSFTDMGRPASGRGAGMAGVSTMVGLAP